MNITLAIFAVLCYAIASAFLKDTSDSLCPTILVGIFVSLGLILTFFAFRGEPNKNEKQYTEIKCHTYSVDSTILITSGDTVKTYTIKFE